MLVLIAVFAASRFFRSPGLESNLRKELIKLDTAAISEIRILPAKEHSEELKLNREGKSWKLSKGERKEPADFTTIKNVLSSVVSMQAQRMTSRKKEKWNDFNVGDNSTHVSVYQAGDKVADFHVGKIGFVQGNEGGFGGAYTYVRLSDENEVYTVDGFLESTFNNTFNEWRDKTFLKLDKSAIKKISYQFPLDSGYVVEKRDSVWYVGNEKVEPSKIENMLNHYSSKYMTEFADGFIPASQPTVTIQVDGPSGNLVLIEGWRRDDTEWTLTSSIQKGVYFSSKGSSVIADLFMGKNTWIAGAK